MFRAYGEEMIYAQFVKILDTKLDKDTKVILGKVLGQGYVANSSYVNCTEQRLLKKI